MFTLNCNGRLLVIQQPMVMGIINTTPDSFYQLSRKNNVDELLLQADNMLAAGATILDIGGQSTRPGSVPVNAVEEMERVMPAIRAVRRHFPQAFISIDTYYASIAQQAVEAGADMVNDVSAGWLDAEMLATVGGLNVPYICMHMQGHPQTMQHNPVYNHVTCDVLDYFIQRIEDCRLAGISDVIVDPGFGFGKTIEHNLQLLRQLSTFKMLNKPLLIGISRKGTVYKTLGITADEALNGTTVLNTIGLLNGAHILRVHDVKEAREAVTLVQAYTDAGIGKC